MGYSLHGTPTVKLLLIAPGADLPNYTDEERIELAAAAAVTAMTVYAALEKKAVGNVVQAVLALASIVHLYHLVQNS
jgi:hypothetical protein